MIFFSLIFVFVVWCWCWILYTNKVQVYVLCCGHTIEITTLWNPKRKAKKRWQINNNIEENRVVNARNWIHWITKWIEPNACNIHIHIKCHMKELLSPKLFGFMFSSFYLSLFQLQTLILSVNLCLLYNTSLDI